MLVAIMTLRLLCASPGYRSVPYAVEVRLERASDEEMGVLSTVVTQYVVPQRVCPHRDSTAVIVPKYRGDTERRRSPVRGCVVRIGQEKEC